MLRRPCRKKSKSYTKTQFILWGKGETKKSCIYFYIVYTCNILLYILNLLKRINMYLRKLPVAQQNWIQFYSLKTIFIFQPGTIIFEISFRIKGKHDNHRQSNKNARRKIASKRFNNFAPKIIRQYGALNLRPESKHPQESLLLNSLKNESLETDQRCVFQE